MRVRSVNRVDGAKICGSGRIGEFSLIEPLTHCRTLNYNIVLFFSNPRAHLPNHHPLVSITHSLLASNTDHYISAQSF